MPVHRVTATRDAFEDPQLIAREHFVEVDHPVFGSAPYENALSRCSVTPAVLRPCPTLGQHNSFVLEEILGYSEDEITELVISGAIE